LAKGRRSDRTPTQSILSDPGRPSWAVCNDVSCTVDFCRGNSFPGRGSKIIRNMCTCQQTCKQQVSGVYSKAVATGIYEDHPGLDSSGEARTMAKHLLKQSPKIGTEFLYSRKGGTQPTGELSVR
jgi:hypothetical protein